MLLWLLSFLYSLYTKTFKLYWVVLKCIMACKYLGTLSTYDLKGVAASGKSCLDLRETGCTKGRNKREISEFCWRVKDEC